MIIIMMMNNNNNDDDDDDDDHDDTEGLGFRFLYNSLLYRELTPTHAFTWQPSNARMTYNTLHPRDASALLLVWTDLKSILFPSPFNSVPQLEPLR